MQKSIIIRSAEPNDVIPILNLYKYFIESTFVSFETEVPDEASFLNRMVTIQKTNPWIVCNINGEFAGYAYASEHRSRAAYQWSKEVSVYIVEKYRKMGVATALYTSLFEILRAQGIVNILAGIALPNDQSVFFHEKMGFASVGVYHNVGYKMGRLRDVGWWEMLIQKEDYIPGELVLIKTLMEKPAWKIALEKGIQCVK